MHQISTKLFGFQLCHRYGVSEKLASSEASRQLTSLVILDVQAPINEGAGAPRDPAKTFDANNEDPYWTYSRGGIVDRKDGQKGREPFVSDLDDK